MIDGWPTADTDEKRQQLMDDFNTILSKEPWVSPICTTVQFWAHTAKVKNLHYDVMSIPRLHHIYMET